MPVLKEGQVLRVQIAEHATVYPTDEIRRHKFDPLSPGQIRGGATWHNFKTGPYNQFEEFTATPIDILELPEDFSVTHVATGGNYTDWYYLERRPKKNGIPNEYVVNANDLIPMNFEYPTIMTKSFLASLQETLANAQLEAARLSRNSEVRLGTADRLAIHLKIIGVNVSDFDIPNRYQ